MAKLLEGRVALVTGGGTGIGLGIAERFAAEGAAVAITGRRKEPLEAAAGQLRKAGGQVLTISGDVSKAADCARMVDETVKRFGKLHVLVNNAGVFRMAPAEGMSEANVHAIVDIDLKGPIFLVQAALKELRKQRAENPSILNISSGAGLVPVVGLSVYSSVKAGMIHWTKCLAKELGLAGVRVNVICPGVVETPIFETAMPKDAVGDAMEGYAKMHPLGRVGQPEDIAGAALFLSGPEASWITGAIFSVDGGLSLA